MWTYLCACASCGYSLPPIEYLCKKCWAELDRELRHFEYDHHPWKTVTLWEWQEKRSLVHILLDRRKACSIKNREWRLAFGLVESLPNEFRDSVDGVVFPSKKPKVKDHTWHLAHAVGEILQLPVVPVIIPASAAYKTYGRRQRAEERLKNLGLYTSYQGKIPLMVDDIITTGATLSAVWRAIGCPKYAIALCLAYKTFNPVDKI
jgi:predicted amidophosphoribosyltransferase